MMRIERVTVKLRPNEARKLKRLCDELRFRTMDQAMRHYALLAAEVILREIETERQEVHDAQ